MFGIFAGVDNQVNMVGQAVCEDLAVVRGFPGSEIVEVIAIVVRLGKDCLAIMTTLDDVMGIVGKGNAGGSWHGRSVTNGGRSCQ